MEYTIKELLQAPGYYLSTAGEIFSTKNKKEFFPIKLGNTSSGYTTTTLSTNGVKKTYKVHRLVAEMYIPKPEGQRMTVDHIDEDKTNNKVENLRWISLKDNINRSVAKPIQATNVQDPTIQIEFLNLSEAAAFTGATPSNISKVLKGQRKTSMGWTYVYLNICPKKFMGE